MKQVGNADGVQIPNAMLTSGQNVYAWVFLHEGNSDGDPVEVLIHDKILVGLCVLYLILMFVLLYVFR